MNNTISLRELKGLLELRDYSPDRALIEARGFINDSLNDEYLDELLLAIELSEDIDVKLSLLDDLLFINKHLYIEGIL